MNQLVNNHKIISSIISLPKIRVADETLSAETETRLRLFKTKPETRLKRDVRYTRRDRDETETFI